MKITKIFTVGAFLGMGLASCTNDNLDVADSRMGFVSLEVANLKPTPKSAHTRAVETEDYPVNVFRATDDKEVLAYTKASLIPNRVTLPVGQYYVTAHTPGALEKIMTKPYYYGEETFEILTSVNTETTVTCRMANSSFRLTFSDAFKQAFADWTISIDDGSNTALVYELSADGWTPAIKYMYFDEKITTLKVNFRGTTTSGNRIVTNSNLTKKNASEEYDSDNEYFEGGDAIEVTFNPVESTTGEISGITLSANISFEETEENFDMGVEDATGSDSGDDDNNPGDGGDDGSGDGGDDNNPGGGNENTITLDLPENMTVSATTDPSLGDTYIAASAGIKSIKVKITSSSEEMMTSLADLNEGYGVDFIGGAEVVGNDALVLLFNDLEQTLAVPAEGDKEYTFPIGNFFLLLAFLPGEHTFDLVVTDMNGKEEAGQVVLTVE